MISAQHDNLTEAQQQQAIAVAETEALRKRAIRKLDWRTLPFLTLAWLANFIDRTSIGNAATLHLTQDLKLHGLQLNTALAAFYVSYILSEIPSNIMLKKLGGDKWIPSLILAWAIVTTLTCLVQDFEGLVTIRVFLGLCEGGVLPGMTLYLSLLYPRYELQQRIGIFYAAAALSGSFGGLLAYLIHKLDGVGGLAGWRYIFLLEGCATVLIAILGFVIMPSSVAGAKFLTQEERNACLAAMNPDIAASLMSTNSATRADNDSDIDQVRDITTLRGSDEAATPNEKETNEKEKETSSVKSLSQQSRVLTATSSGPRDAIRIAAAAGAKFDASAVEKFEWREVRRGLCEVQVWLTGLAYLCMLNSLYSYSLFLPTILRSMYPDVTPARLQLLSVPPYVPAAVMCIVIAIAADRARMRVPFMLVLLPISMVGYIILLTVHSAEAKYAGVFLAALGVYPATPCVLSILPNNCSGHFKRATAVALQLAIANCAGFVATFAYQSKFAKDNYKQGHWVVLGSLILAEVLLIGQVFYVRWENAARASGKRDHQIADYEKLVAEGKTQAPIGDRSPTYRFVI
ncbi:hypothetical protein A4X13_0g1913 [Tilletia indica]|uniref:Major facilitator superfamily (MFS) profile domain-containing protein n=1 Tax=Tilletia indica TaxID=43049 RepID=A0A177TKV0_9BASI|nr:hypothetical protein A4X13_0g1913 [Tilletia indica]